MSQKESLTLAKDMIELQSKELGYSGKWLKAAENSVADETEVKEPIEVIRQALPDSVVVVVTSLNIIFVG
jgi:hypothetical protein